MGSQCNGGKGLDLLAYKCELMLHIALDRLASLQDYPECWLHDKWVLERLGSKTEQREHYKRYTSQVTLSNRKPGAIILAKQYLG